MADFASIRFQPSRPLLRELSADRLNTILTEIKRNKPKGERGITVRQDGTGTYIGLAAALPRASSGSVSTRQPWDLVVTPDPQSQADEPPNLVTVTPGTLNGILPSNWNISKSIPAANDTLHYAKAVIATDGQDITGVSIEIDTTAPVVAEAELFSIPSTIDYLFGLYKEGQVYRVIGAGSIVVSPQLWLTLEKANALPGELPYELYYSLLQ